MGYIFLQENPRKIVLTSDELVLHCNYCNMEVTTEQIARRVGCSTATVSRVMNGSGPVSRETQEAVLKVVEEMGVNPRRRRRQAGKGPWTTGSGTKQTGLVEVVMHLVSPIEHLDVHNGQIKLGPIAHCSPDRFLRPENRYCNTHFRRIIDGAMDELTRWRLRPVLRTTNNLEDDQLMGDINLPDMLGVILLGNDSPAADTFLRRCRCPFVSFVGAGRNDWPHVASDDIPGMRQAITHLVKLGHSRIAYIACSASAPGFAERFTAFKVAMAEAGLAIREDWVFEDSFHVADIAAGMDKMLATADRPTAVVCSYDSAALGVIQAATRHGLRVPDDLSVVGFGDQDIAELVRPGLTTVHAPTYEMGRAAVKLLMMQRMQPESGDGLSMRLATHLVERGSTALVKSEPNLQS